MRITLATARLAVISAGLVALAGCVRDNIPGFEVNNLDVPDEARSAEYERRKTDAKGPAEPGVSVKKKTVAEPGVAAPGAVKPKTASSAKGRLLTPASFVTKWNFLGPFSFEPRAGESAADAIHREFAPDEAALDGTASAPEGARWRLHDFFGDSPMGETKMKLLFPEAKNGVAYAVCYLYSPEDMDDATLHVGSGGFVKIWVNKKLVHAYNKNGRKAEWDQDVVKNVRIKKGHNLVVVKCAEHAGEWSFYFRLATAADVPVGVARPPEPGKGL